jgi:tetratricopeptide (TPR) repeat protein
MMNELEALRNSGLTLSVTARTQIAQAEAFRLDGLRNYLEAQNALSRQNFDVARDRLTRAAEQYDNSLAIQESQVIRNELYPQLVTLGHNINRIENEVVIRDVRELVTTARNAYFSGNFDRAEELLVRAQNRWLVTNTENDEEVIYWLNMVRGAVSLRSGRVIPATAPLFPEMSQLLSQARRFYEEGVRLLNTGQRSQGVAVFNEARQKTREVKLMFPMNQEAGILELMMDRVLDPQAFDNDFERRLRTAIAGTENRSIEAFADLQNLAEINPRYPGMAGIINRAEIVMGIRPPPPDPRAVSRSNELTASALRILDGNMSTQFEVALTQINEAISLNPNNTQATVVKDRLLNRMAQPNAIVMNSQDEAAYNQALMEYQQGNYLMALAIVQRLLQNPQYRNIAKILELQRRVQALL